MEAIDFLTILGIGIALWQFISPRERKIIGLYFSPFEIRLAILLIVFIHYIFAFEWLLLNWFPCLSFFTYKKGIPPNTFAYLVSLLLILYPVLKIKYGFFSKSRREGLIKWYKQLLKDGEIDLLVNYIKKYHLEDIKSFLSAYSELPEEDHLFHREPEEETERSRAFDKLIKKNRMNYAYAIEYGIITTEPFIDKASKKHIDVIAEVTKAGAESNLQQREFVQKVLEKVFKNKHPEFIEELKLVSGSNDSIKNLSEKFHIPLLESLLINSEIAHKNEVWKPVFDLTKTSLKEDIKQTDFLRKESDFLLKDKLWEQPVYIAIVYYNYMIRESIYRDGGWHMWLFLYDRIIKILTDSIITVSDLTKDTFAHKLIKIIIDNMLGWLDLAKEQNVEYRVIDTIRCLGKILETISETKETKISEEFKIGQLKRIIKKWFLLFDYPESKGAKLAMEWIEFMLLNPENPSHEADEFPENYLNLLQESWNKFDKVPYREWENQGQIEKFNEKVLKPLGIETTN